MKVDCNLKKMASFFKFVLCILEKSLKTDNTLFLLGEKTKYFLPGFVRTILWEYTETRFFVKY